MPDCYYFNNNRQSAVCASATQWESLDPSVRIKGVPDSQIARQPNRPQPPTIALLCCRLAVLPSSLLCSVTGSSGPEPPCRILRSVSKWRPGHFTLKRLNCTRLLTLIFWFPFLFDFRDTLTRDDRFSGRFLGAAETAVVTLPVWESNRCIGDQRQSRQGVPYREVGCVAIRTSCQVH